MSQVTTHVLDTSLGKPVPHLNVVFYHGENDEWTELSRCITNDDGRISNLLRDGLALQRGIYKLRFETKDYYDVQQVSTFYPFVEITFDLQDGEHYHVPLLLSPYGYSTYRGS